MPQGFDFLKHGRPMVAAAPLLLALSAVPSPAHACTGSANDPEFCAQVNGQFVTGIGTFLQDNLVGIPGSSPIPGSTPVEDEFDFGDIGSPVDDDDNDLGNVFRDDPEFGGSGFSENGFGLQPIDFTQPGIPIPSATPNNSSVSVGAPVTTFPISGFPQLPAAPGTGSASPAPGGFSYPALQVQPIPVGGGALSIGSTLNGFTILGGQLQIITNDETVPPAIQSLVDQSEGTNSGGAGCSLNVPSCQLGVQNIFITIRSNDVIPPENIVPVLNVLINGSPSTASLDAGAAQIGDDPDDKAGLRTHYNIPVSTQASTGNTSDDAAGDAFVNRQVASINKLREEVENAPDAETRQAKQAELQRKESRIRQLGSAAIRNALGLGDANSAPVPSRN